MNIKYTTFLLLLFVLAACKSDPKTLSADGVVMPAVDNRDDKLPFACDVLSAKQMLAILDMEVDLEVLDGNRNSKETGANATKNSTSCFYKWDDPKYDVSGVVIQISRNPFPDEIPDYIDKYMNNKRYEGEHSYDDADVVFKYSDLEGFDFPVIYSRETYRYYFGIDNTYLCQVTFNYPAKPEQLDAWFKDIARKMAKEV